MRSRREPEYIMVMSNWTTRAGLNDDTNDSYSSAAMSIRAEQILANAKKRLTVRCSEESQSSLEFTDLS